MDDDARFDAQLNDLIAGVDLDGLIRLIERRCDVGDWAGVERLRRRCVAATRETGRQLWPAATLAEYRLALDAPVEWAAPLLDDEGGRLTIGPLSEVAAVHHSFADMHPWLSATATATFFAHERGIRGEIIGDTRDLPPVLDIPADPEEWEPAYPVATYTEFGLDEAQPSRTERPIVVIDTRTTHQPADIVDDPEFDQAVGHLVEEWTTRSTGRSENVCVEGDLAGALARLGVRSARVVEIPATEAMAEIAWVGASGGAHGRRRGMASGRYSMWWLLAAIGDLEWPLQSSDVVAALANLRFFRWDAFEPPTGWRLQLAVVDATEGYCWIVNARDDA